MQRTLSRSTTEAVDDMFADTPNDTPTETPDDSPVKAPVDPTGAPVEAANETSTDPPLDVPTDAYVDSTATTPSKPTAGSPMEVEEPPFRMELTPELLAEFNKRNEACKTKLTLDEYWALYPKAVLSKPPPSFDVNSPTFVEDAIQHLKSLYKSDHHSHQVLPIYVRGAVAVKNNKPTTIKDACKRILEVLDTTRKEIVDADFYAGLQHPTKVVPLHDPKFLSETLQNDFYPEEDRLLLAPGTPMPVFGYAATPKRGSKTGEKVNEIKFLFMAGPYSQMATFPPTTLKELGCKSPYICESLLNSTLYGKEQAVHMIKGFAGELLDGKYAMDPFDTFRARNLLKIADQVYKKKLEVSSTITDKDRIDRLRDAGLDAAALTEVRRLELVVEATIQSNKDIAEENKKRKRNGDSTEAPRLFLSSEDGKSLWNIARQLFDGVGVIYEGDESMHKIYKKIGNAVSLKSKFFDEMMGAPFSNFNIYKTLGHKTPGLSTYIAAANIALSWAGGDEDFTEQLYFDLENNIYPCETAWHGAGNGFGPDSVDLPWSDEYACIQYAYIPYFFTNKLPSYNLLGRGAYFIKQLTKQSKDAVEHFKSGHLAPLTKENASTYAAMLFDHVFDALGSNSA